MAFYACICGVLGVASPRLGSMPVRLAIGAAVGVVAALILPVVRGVFY